MAGTEPTEKKTRPAEIGSVPIPVLFDKLTEMDIAILSVTAEGWRPEDGDQIKGRVLAVKIGHSDLNDKFPEYPIVVILPDGATTADKAITVHGFHLVLRNELISQRPEYGDKIFIMAMGNLGRESKVKGQEPPEIYAVHVTKPPGQVRRSAWDTFSNTSSA